MEIQSIDHIELFVEDAEEAAFSLRDHFGFAVAGRGGLVRVCTDASRCCCAKATSPYW